MTFQKMNEHGLGLYIITIFCKLSQLSGVTVNCGLSARLKDDLIRFKEHVDCLEPDDQFIFSCSEIILE